MVIYKKNIIKRILLYFILSLNFCFSMENENNKNFIVDAENQKKYDFLETLGINIFPKNWKFSIIEYIFDKYKYLQYLRISKTKNCIEYYYEYDKDYSKYGDMDINNAYSNILSKLNKVGDVADSEELNNTKEWLSADKNQNNNKYIETGIFDPKVNNDMGILKEKIKYLKFLKHVFLQIFNNTCFNVAHSYRYILEIKNIICCDSSADYEPLKKELEENYKKIFLNRENTRENTCEIVVKEPKDNKNNFIFIVDDKFEKIKIDYKKFYNQNFIIPIIFKRLFELEEKYHQLLYDEKLSIYKKTGTFLLLWLILHKYGNSKYAGPTAKLMAFPGNWINKKTGLKILI
jgi:hypothetical protein